MENQFYNIRNEKEMYINEQSKIELNGKKQYISIRSKKENLPLLLYLHGGPGDSALPLVLKYNSELESHFTVVVWEQRGAGKSYYDFKNSEITIDMFLEDIYKLSKLLTERFNQEKLYILGHSWGSVLGLKFIQKHPEIVIKYIGCGQVVNMKKSCKAAYDFALTHADIKTKEILNKIDCSYDGDNWLKDLLYVTKQVVKHRGSLYGKTNYNSLVYPFLFSKYYSIPDLYRRQMGSLRSIKYLWQELMEVNFENQVKYKVPVIFIEGEHDRHVSSELVKNYFDTIETDKHFYLFEKSCHFPQWSENEKFNNLLIDLCK